MANAIAAKLKIPKDRYKVSFQSRLGKDAWCEPYISDTIKALAARGIKKILIFSPAFVADCLETLYEITVELEHEFRTYGGEKIDLVEGLNSDPHWIEALKTIIGERV